MEHALPALPYAMDALQPHISKETLEFHYGKHHQAYVTNGNNLLIAQHRDQHRYARVRAGGYKPRFRSFQVGDYVYVLLRNQVNTLQLPARETVLRIANITDQGVATLIGRDGTAVKEHVSNLVPCHLQDLDPIVDPRISVPPLDLPCEVCAFPGDESKMLICDGCGTGWHMYCLSPPIARLPPGTWACPDCHAACVTPAAIDQRAAAQPREPAKPSPFLSADARRRLAQAQALDGRNCLRTVKDPATGRSRELRGALHFLGAEARPHPLEAAYTDGTTERLNLRSARTLVEAAEKAAAWRGRVTMALSSSLSLPDTWDVTSAGARGAALLKLCSVVELAASVPDRLSAPPSGTPPSAAALDALLAHLDLSRSPSLLDPCPGDGSLPAALRARGYHVCAYEAWPDSPPDAAARGALQPSLYRDLATPQCWHVVSAPSADILPMWLPLVIAMVPVVAAFIPRSWTVAPSPAWSKLLSALSEDERLAIVTGSPDGFTCGQPGAWVVVFSDRELRGKLMRGVANGQAGHVVHL